MKNHIDIFLVYKKLYNVNDKKKQFEIENYQKLLKTLNVSAKLHV